MFSKANGSWQTKKLGELVDIAGGFGFPKEYQGSNVGTVPFYKVSDMNNASNTVYMCESNNRVNDEVLKKIKAKVYPKGTVIFPKIGMAVFTNKKRILSTNSTFDNNVMGLTPRTINGLFLYYYLLTIDLSKLSKATTMPSISQQDIKKITIPFPSTQIQDEIVKKLDSIRKLQEVNQKEIEKVEELFISFVSKWFKPGGDWKVKKLEEVVVNIQNGYASRPVSEEKGIAQIRPHNITREGQFSLEGIKYVPFVKKDNYLVKKGDVIFNNTNSAELVGKTAYIGEDIKVVFSNHMTRIRVDEAKISPYFLATYLHTLYRSRYFQGLCTAWVNQAAINSTLLKGLKIPLPPIGEQKNIVDRFSTLKDYKNTLSDEEIKLTELFESTLSKLMKPN